VDKQNVMDDNIFQLAEAACNCNFQTRKSFPAKNTAVVFRSKCGPFYLTDYCCDTHLYLLTNLLSIIKAVAVVSPPLMVILFACSSSLPSLYQEFCHIIDHTNNFLPSDPHQMDLISSFFVN